MRKSSTSPALSFPLPPLLISAVLLVAACGQTGPLVLPEKAEPVTEPPAAAGETAREVGEAQPDETQDEQAEEESEAESPAPAAKTNPDHDNSQTSPQPQP